MLEVYLLMYEHFGYAPANKYNLYLSFAGFVYRYLAPKYHGISVQKSHIGGP
jgi:hypothetical protein